MSRTLFNDPMHKPDENLVFSVIGEKKAYWIELLSHFQNTIPEFSTQWNYYNDGKSWLFKATSRKKTVFWLSMIENTFRISFYIAEKAEDMILNSGLPDSVKEEYRNARRFNIGRSITINVNSESDVNIIKQLAEIKCKIK